MKLSDKDVKAARSAYETAAKAENNRIEAGLKAKRITPQQAAKAASNFTFDVPDKVRDLLSRDQRAFLATCSARNASTSDVDGSVDDRIAILNADSASGSSHFPGLPGMRGGVFGADCDLKGLVRASRLRSRLPCR